MGFVHQYSVDPSTLGSYAFSGAAAKATRENLQRAAEMRQNAAQFNAQLGQHAIDRAVNQYDRQQGRAADIYQQQMQADSYALKNQYDLQKAQEANAADLQIEQMQQNAARANQFEKTKQEWLKQGIAKYSPQNKQQIAEFQRQAAIIDLDPSISPEHKEQMIANLHGKIQAVIPQMVPEDERPVPFHERAGQDIAVMNERGEVIPLSQLGRSPKDGELIVTGTMRNGAMNYKAQPFTSKPQDGWQNPAYQQEQRNKAYDRVAADRTAKYTAAYNSWKAQHDEYLKTVDTAGGATVQKPGAPPTMGDITPQAIDEALWQMSGGQAGAAPQQQWDQGFLQPIFHEDGSRVVRVQSEAELKTLKPGMRFILPNGKSGRIE